MAARIELVLETPDLLFQHLVVGLQLTDAGFGGQPEQSYSERQLYEKALARMAREVAAVEHTDEQTAVKRVEGMLTKKAA